MDLTLVKGSSLAQQLDNEALFCGGFFFRSGAQVGQLGVLTHSRAGVC